jgi:hypothetical protein
MIFNGGGNSSSDNLSYTPFTTYRSLTLSPILPFSHFQSRGGGEGGRGGATHTIEIKRM